MGKGDQMQQGAAPDSRAERRRLFEKDVQTMFQRWVEVGVSVDESNIWARLLEKGLGSDEYLLSVSSEDGTTESLDNLQGEKLAVALHGQLKRVLRIGGGYKMTFLTYPQ